MKIRQLLTKILALVCLGATFGLVFSDKEIASSVIDVRAGLLVFICPLLVLLVFQKESISWGQVFRRVRESLSLESQELMENLHQNTQNARGQYGYSHVLKFSENHKDSMVRYAGEVFSARFNAQEQAKLLVSRIQAEDAEWQSIYNFFGFLAKMAPYFGMTATVVGIIKLLENMTDFAHISANMALAMQGTLYGLFSFLIIYSPMQKFVSEQRTQILKRNEMIAQWFILIAEQADPIYIQKEIRSGFLNAEVAATSAKVEASAQNASANAPRSTS